MNEFLKTREQINQSTKWLQERGFTTHPISAKDWELKLVTEAIEDGNTIDLGADGSFCLHNLIKKGFVGRKVGIDLTEVTGDNKAVGAEYYQGDLMSTDLPDESFNNAVCLSVLEHQVNYTLFAKEVSRLLGPNGKLYLSFDFWEPKPDTSLTKLYALDWNILDKSDVLRLIDILSQNDLELTSEIDWTTQDAVINPTYCSPVQGVSYTFSFLNFVKK